ncbi:hypothetical protein FXW78_24295 [Rhodococcus opacus]|nr:hypothetical protein [Rhodococcus opacus]
MSSFPRTGTGRDARPACADTALVLREPGADRFGCADSPGRAVRLVDTAGDQALARDTLWQPAAGDPLRGLLRDPVGSRPPGICSRDPLLRNIAVGLGGVGPPWGSDTGEDRGLRGPVVAGLGNHPRLEE